MTPELIGQAQDFLRQPRTLGGVAVVGDLGIDRFVFGAVDRISPEAPVPVLLIEKTQDRWGCAANVARNLNAWKSTHPAAVHVVGLVGKDPEGHWLRDELAREQVEAHLLEDAARPTTLKTRFVAGSQHQLLRVDSERAEPIEAAQEEHIFESVRALFKKVRCLIVQDYAKGLLTPSLLKRLLAEARGAGVLTLVDPHPRAPAAIYRGAGLVTPNIAEAENLLGESLQKGRDNEHVAEACRRLKEQLDLNSVIITRSSYGMTLLDQNSQVHHFPTMARAVYDVTGAGDTVAAVLALGYSAGLSLPVAATLATAAASVVVGKVGTATATVSEIQNELQEFQSKPLK